MNVFKRITATTLKKNKTRTGVTLVGVILFVATITGILFFATSFHDYFERDIRSQSGDWCVAVENLDQELTKEITGGEEGYGEVWSIGYGTIASNPNPQKPYVFIASYKDNMEEISKVKLISGRMPENDTELVVSEHLLDQVGENYAEGETLTMEMGSRISTANGEELGQFDRYNPASEAFIGANKKKYTVVGICKRTAIEPFLAPGYTAITKDSKTTVDKQYTFIKSELYPKVKEYLGEGYLTETSKMHLNENLLKVQGELGESVFNSALFGLSGILILLVFLGAIMLLYNAFNISVKERRKQLSILASVGATGRQLKYTIMYEGAFLGFVGIPVGICFGVMETQVVINFIENYTEAFRTESGTDLLLSVPPWALAMVLVISTLLLVLSLILPAYEISKTVPILDRIITRSKTQSVKPARPNKFIKKHLSSEAYIANKNFARNRKQYLTTIISLSLSIVVFMTATSFSHYLKNSMEGLFDESDGFDILYRGEDKEETEAAFMKLKSAEGISSSVNYYVLPMTGTIGNVTGGSEVIVLNDDALKEYLNENHIGTNGFFNPEEPKFIAVTSFEVYNKRTGEYELRDIYSKEHRPTHISGTVNGKTVILQISNYAKRLPRGVKEIVERPTVVTSKTAVKTLFKDATNESIGSGALFKTSDPTSTYEAMKIICRENGFVTANLSNLAEARNERKGLLLVIKLFSYGFILLLSLIAVANVVNSISTNMERRKYEFATYLAIGMGNKSFKKMLAYEAFYLGLRALSIGLPLGILSTVMVYKTAMYVTGLGYILPIGSSAISIGVVFAIVFLTMLFAFRKMKTDELSTILKSSNF